MMKQKALFIQTLVVLIFCSTTVFSQYSKTKNLMPVPRSMEQTNEKLYIKRDFKISVTSNHGNSLFEYATWVLRRLDKRTGLCFYQDVLTSDKKVEQPQMTIHSMRQGSVLLNQDESYSLTINNKNIILSAKTNLGAMRGMETFLQLLEADENGYYFPTVNITDEPRFSWRGLMIDVSRHFHDVGVIKRNIDAMAAMKMNVLHLHLCDDQGFRIESKVFPKLHLKASDGEYYTQEQMKDIINYARKRGIRVIPEFDVPAHATSFIVAYPELGSSNEISSLERGWGVKNPVLNPAKSITYKFLDKFFEEMTMLFPDPFFHIGGDENNGKHWAANPDIQNFMKENKISDKHQLQTYFNKQVLKILTKYNKKMIGWDEILQPNLPKNSVIHSWRGKLQCGVNLLIVM